MHRTLRRLDWIVCLTASITLGKAVTRRTACPGLPGVALRKELSGNGEVTFSACYAKHVQFVRSVVQTQPCPSASYAAPPRRSMSLNNQLIRTARSR